MIMKNEKYIAPEMEVVDVKVDSMLMWSGCAPEISDYCPTQGVVTCSTKMCRNDVG